MDRRIRQSRIHIILNKKKIQRVRWIASWSDSRYEQERCYFVVILRTKSRARH